MGIVDDDTGISGRLTRKLGCGGDHQHYTDLDRNSLHHGEVV